MITIVSGVPRSGTSMVMRALELGGLPAFRDVFRSEPFKDAGNPNGYYELGYQPRLWDWLEDCHGMCVKVFAQRLRAMPEKTDCKILLLRRDPDEVADSQLALSALRGVMRGVTPRLTREELLARNEQAIANGLSTPHPVLEVRYSEVLADPKAEMRRIVEFLALELDADAMAASVDPSLYRVRHAR